MSKYKIDNGIWTTPVFHGDSCFFIKRKEFKEVEERREAHPYLEPIRLVSTTDNRGHLKTSPPYE